VGHRAGLDCVEKRKFFILPGVEPRTLGRPVRAQSLYRQRYRAPQLKDKFSYENKISGSIKVEYIFTK
jgi:hypothetical protein